MLITNHTRYCIGVNANEFVGMIPPESQARIPDDVGEEWLQKSTPAVLRERGLITVTVEAKATPTETDEDTTGLPWRDAVEVVGALTDLDELVALHAAETRKKVLIAIEARMAELG